jgi:ketosteroid isomerase-like protein
MRTIMSLALRSRIPVGLGLCFLLVFHVYSRSSVAAAEHDVIALERAALDQWGKGDPSALLKTYAQEITYFDAATKQRIDGHAAMTTYYQPLPGQIMWTHWEMIEPKVQQHGDVAVLTYRLNTDGTLSGKPAKTDWNSTSVYARIDGKWQMIHSHWSLTALPCANGIM